MQLGNVVFPARAGMIRRSQPRRYPEHRIPRESGDDPVWDFLAGAAKAYSPRERG